jgi:polyhydroxybutyrate depolymerase
MSRAGHHFVSFFLSVAVVWLAFAPFAPVSACDAFTSCQVSNGSYLVRPPARWDGRTALPVIVFFHGAFSDAKDTMGREDLRKAADEVGALLVAADGANKNWSFPGKMSNDRDDFAYVSNVLDDVGRRFPVEADSVLASGFSVGGSMAWYAACFLGQRFAAFAPVAGAYWEPLPEACPSGPVSLRHVHGLADATVPMKGRSLRNGLWKQGDVLESFRRLRMRNGCGDEPDSVESSGNMTCRTWSATSCSSGREAVLCLHPEDHIVDGQWVADGFRWMQGGRKGDAGERRR